MTVEAQGIVLEALYEVHGREQKKWWTQQVKCELTNNDAYKCIMYIAGFETYTSNKHTPCTVVQNHKC